MALFENQVLTLDGWQAMSESLGGGQLIFYKLVAGQGDITDDSELPPLTQLVDHVTDIPLTNYRIDGDGQVTLIGVLSSALIDRLGDGSGLGFTFKELGVVAVIEPPGPFGGTPASFEVKTKGLGDQRTITVPPPVGTTGPSILYSVTNAGANSDYVPGMGEASQVVNSIEVTIKIDPAASFRVEIVPGDLTDAQNIGLPAVGAGVYSFKDAALNLIMLKRLVEGPNIELIETPTTVTIGVKTLTVDLDVYVPLAYPGLPAGGIAFDTLSEAFDYLMGYHIPITVTATINIGPGMLSIDTPLVFDHPDGKKIQILGYSPIIKDIVSYVGVDFRTIDYTVGDSIGLVNDEFVACYGPGYNVHAKGAMRINNPPTGNIINADSGLPVNVPVLTASGPRPGTMIKYPTIINFSSFVNPIDGSNISCLELGDIGLVRDVTFLGLRTNWETNQVRCLDIKKTAVLRNLILAWFGVGISAKGGEASIVADSIDTINCCYGVSVTLGSYFSCQTRMSCNGAYSRGFYLRAAVVDLLGNADSAISLTGNGVWGTAAGVLGDGLITDTNGTALIGGITCNFNNSGFNVYAGGTIVFGAPAFPQTAVSNAGLFDAFASLGGRILGAMNGGTIGRFSPVNQAGADNSGALIFLTP